MKNLLLILLIFVIVKCTNKEETEPINMTGVYSLTKQTLSNGSKDSLVEKRQLKIYTDKYMMYASPNATDSLANYGIATYKVDDGKIIENIFYTSGYGDRKDSAILKVEKIMDGYKQVIEDAAVENKKFKSTEEYDSVGKASSTPLDGVWKMKTRMHVGKKSDTLVDDFQVQFKAGSGIVSPNIFAWSVQMSTNFWRSSSLVKRFIFHFMLCAVCGELSSFGPNIIRLGHHQRLSASCAISFCSLLPWQSVSNI